MAGQRDYQRELDLIRNSGQASPAVPGGSGGLSGILGASNPFTEAANVQVEALQDAIPFFQPFLDVGTQGLESFAQGSTPQGLSDMIDQIINGGLFEDLVDERQDAVTSQLAAGGLTRSGAAIEEAARIPTDVALALENILSGRQAGLADIGFSGASNIGSLTTRVGEAIASGILGNEARRASDRATSKTNKSNIIGSVLGGLFSDPRLKENIRKVDKIGPLDLVQWDWSKEAKPIVKDMPTHGFLSTQVKEHYPEFVHQYGGFDVIDYPNLIEHLKCH